MKKIIGMIVGVAFAVFMFTGFVFAAGKSNVPKQDWSFSGPFGTYDKHQLQRGFQVYKQVCASCHGLKMVAFRHLSGLGYDEEAIKAFARDIEVMGEPNSDGDVNPRPGKPSDYFPEPYDNPEQAAALNNRKAPPDLSLMAKSTKQGPDHIYAVLVGYTDPPADVELGTGQYYNKYFHNGSVIAMPPPLLGNDVEYQDGTKATLEQEAKDVSAFLMWAAEPKMDKRKRIGVAVVLFLCAFTVLMFVAYARVKREVLGK